MEGPKRVELNHAISIQTTGTRGATWAGCRGPKASTHDVKSKRRKKEHTHNRWLSSVCGYRFFLLFPLERALDGGRGFACWCPSIDEALPRYDGWMVGRPLRRAKTTPVSLVAARFRTSLARRVATHTASTFRQWEARIAACARDRQSSMRATRMSGWRACVCVGVGGSSWVAAAGCQLSPPSHRRACQKPHGLTQTHHHHRNNRGTMSHRKFRAPRHGSLGFLVRTVRSRRREIVGLPACSDRSTTPSLHGCSRSATPTIMNDDSPRSARRSTAARSAPSPRTTPASRRT